MSYVGEEYISICCKDRGSFKGSPGNVHNGGGGTTYVTINVMRGLDTIKRVAIRKLSVSIRKLTVTR